MEKNENGYSEWRNNRDVRDMRMRDGCRQNGNIGNMNGNADNMQGGAVMGENSLGSGPNDCARAQLAMVYSPFQCWRMTYSTEEALRHGTLFEELYKPMEDCANG